MLEPEFEPVDQPRPPSRDFGLVDIAALLLASIAIGVAVSPIMVDVGTPSWVVMAAAMLAYSGTGELAYASVIASGGSLGPALAASLLVSSRFGLLAMSMNGRWKASFWERVGISHYAAEPQVAAALEAEVHGPDAARRAFWQISGWMGIGWVIGSAIGLLIGNAVGDIRTLGLDAVFPATLASALVSSFRRRDTATAVVLGAAAALALTPFLPAGGPVLLAALAAPVALLASPDPLRRPSR